MKRAAWPSEEVYYPKRLTDRDRQVNCHCLCHEGIPEHGEGPCPCKNQQGVTE